jgi:hypothetical protein
MFRALLPVTGTTFFMRTRMKHMCRCLGGGEMARET